MSRYPDSLISEAGKSVSIFTEFHLDTRGRILDVGCGNGFFLKAIQNKGFSDLYAIDIENNLSDITLPTDRFEKLDLSFGKSSKPDNYFDAITAWQVVEHLENPHNFIREAHRILKPGGYFFVSMPNPFHLISRLNFLKHGDMPRWTKKNNHITVFTRNLFYKAFLKDRFCLIDAKYPVGEFTYGIFKHLNGLYPENQWFGHFVVWVLKKQ